MGWSSETHKALSSHYAKSYDIDYGRNATVLYMDYEKRVIEQGVMGLPRKRTAVDVGSGTGRCAFSLSPLFQKVVGFDFAPEMVSKAKAKAVDQGIANITFVQRDVNADGVKPDRISDVDFFNFAFGMGSFIENISGLAAQLESILAPGGQVHITFYNKESFVYEACAEASAELLNALGVSAIPVYGKDLLRVLAEPCEETNGRPYYEIPCKYYTKQELTELFGQSFEILRMATFPTLSPLVYPGFMKVGTLSSFLEQCDQGIADENKGYYISVLLRNKKGDG
ncbi:MAG: class I SAM-dependent methyltransferase [Clostridium sp.]|jgi:SAM-dependent methyltransferase|nr:class I SAM-dependent methyltransferase [Clostridium sp.]